MLNQFKYKKTTNLGRRDTKSSRLEEIEFMYQIIYTERILYLRQIFWEWLYLGWRLNNSKSKSRLFHWKENNEWVSWQNAPLKNQRKNEKLRSGSIKDKLLENFMKRSNLQNHEP